MGGFRVQGLGWGLWGLYHSGSVGCSGLGVLCLGFWKAINPNYPYQGATGTILGGCTSRSKPFYFQGHVTLKFRNTRLNPKPSAQKPVIAPDPKPRLRPKHLNARPQKVLLFCLRATTFVQSCSGIWGFCARAHISGFGV